MERRMGINADVIRFLTVRVEELETEPSAQMRKQDRDERGDRGDRADSAADVAASPPRGDFPGREGGFGGPLASSARRRLDVPSAPPRESGDRGPRPPREAERHRARLVRPRDTTPGSEG